jgi:hypothetical protein
MDLVRMGLAIINLFQFLAAQPKTAARLTPHPC